jgi:hypothetical protein
MLGYLSSDFNDTKPLESAKTAMRPSTSGGRFNGEFRWFLFHGSPLRDRSWKVAKWYGTDTESITIEWKRSVFDSRAAERLNFE